MTVDTIMIAPVVVTQSNKSVGHAKGLINGKNINALPILKMDGTIEGVVTSQDLLQSQNDEQSLGEIMTNRVSVMPKNAGVKDVARVMSSKSIHHVVIMDDGNVVGMVSSLDIVRLFSES